jgi:hypothetical protein
MRPRGLDFKGARDQEAREIRGCPAGDEVTLMGPNDMKTIVVTVAALLVCALRPDAAHAWASQYKPLGPQHQPRLRRNQPHQRLWRQHEPCLR